jgi:hypothetical protein
MLDQTTTSLMFFAGRRVVFRAILLQLLEAFLDASFPPGTGAPSARRQPRRDGQVMRVSGSIEAKRTSSRPMPYQRFHRCGRYILLMVVSREISPGIC